MNLKVGDYFVSYTAFFGKEFGIVTKITNDYIYYRRLFIEANDDIMEGYFTKNSAFYRRCKRITRDEYLMEML